MNATIQRPLDRKLWIKRNRDFKFCRCQTTKRNWRETLGEEVSLLFLYYWVFIYLENVSDDNCELFFIASIEISTIVCSQCVCLGGPIPWGWGQGGISFQCVCPAAVCRACGSWGVNEFWGVSIFSPHVVIPFFDLDSPWGKISGQNRFKTDVES
jgi:hypothetical protein